MKKNYKTILVIAICMALLFSFSSCEKESDNHNYDNRFQEGVEYGIADTFLRIYNAVGFHDEEILKNGDAWNTKHFKLIFTDYNSGGKKYLHIDLTLKNTTLDRCFEYGDLFFNIYSISDTEGMVLSADEFIDLSLFEYSGDTENFLAGNTAKTSIELLDNSDIQTLMIIIVIEGTLYTATYYTK